MHFFYFYVCFGYFSGMGIWDSGVNPSEDSWN